MTTRIFFTVCTDNPDHEPTVAAQVFDNTGELLAEHVMTIEGANIRMHDMHAAIIDARHRRAHLRRSPSTSATRRQPLT